jgi:hypothetical protein
MTTLKANAAMTLNLTSKDCSALELGPFIHNIMKMVEGII